MGEAEIPESIVALTSAIKALKEQNPQVAANVVDEMLEATREGNNIVLVGTDGGKTVTIMHVDKSLINNQDGPVLFPTADPNRALAAVSSQMLERELAIADGMENESMSDMY
jgi:DNA-binding protein YbaB